jgi:glycosyltransferase involved in cell wall biosynthesis
LCRGRPLSPHLQKSGPNQPYCRHRTDVVDWLAACDVVVLPSRWEGMSLGMLEALAAGRSLAVTDVQGAREAVDDSGAIVPPENTEALADA